MCESVDEVPGEAGGDAGVASDFGVPAEGLGILAQRGDVAELGLQDVPQRTRFSASSPVSEESRNTRAGHQTCPPQGEVCSGQAQPTLHGCRWSSAEANSYLGNQARGNRGR